MYDWLLRWLEIKNEIIFFEILKYIWDLDEGINFFFISFNLFLKYEIVFCFFLICNFYNI